jgi:hypothetical protein
MKTLRRLLALTTVLLSMWLFVVHGFAAMPLVVTLYFVSGAAIAGPAALMRGQLGAAPDTHDIISNLNLTEILEPAMETFARALMPLRLFATVFQNVPLKGDGTVTVPYFPLQGITSKNFNANGYSFGTGAGSNTSSRQIGVSQEAGGKRKYQPLAVTSAEVRNLPRLNLEQIGRMRAEKLASDILADVLSPVTASNYGAAAFTGEASTFDSDDVADLRTACNNNTLGPLSVADGATTNASTTVTSATARFNESDIGLSISGAGIPANTTIASVTNGTTAVLSAAATATAAGVTFTLGRPRTPWPETGRGLLVNPDYDGALLKDSNFRRDLTVANQSTVNTGKLPNIYGFDYAQSAAVPTNGENLVGMVTFMSALLVATAPIPPVDDSDIVDYRVLVHPDLGVALEYRKWFNPTLDRLEQVIESNYGYAPGERFALKRLTRA